jgi:hypothetical protein
MSTDNHGEIIIYQTEDGLTQINVNIYAEGELVRESTVANFATVQNEGRQPTLLWWRLIGRLEIPLLRNRVEMKERNMVLDY